MNEKDFVSIDDNLFRIRMTMEDVILSIGSSITVLITIFLTTAIFKIKLQINQIDFWHIVISSMLIWGCIWLINSLLIALFLLIANKSRIVSDNLELITRVLLLAATVVSIFLHSTLLMEIGGISGFVMCLLLFIYKGRFFIFPGEALFHYKWFSFLQSRAFERGANN